MLEQKYLYCEENKTYLQMTMTKEFITPAKADFQGPSEYRSSKLYTSFVSVKY